MIVDCHLDYFPLVALCSLGLPLNDADDYWGNVTTFIGSDLPPKRLSVGNVVCKTFVFIGADY